MLNLEEMEDCLNQKIKMIKSILKLQLKALEMYDKSPENLENLQNYEGIESLKRQILEIDLVFLSHYQKFLSENGVVTLQDLSKGNQVQFEKMQGIIEHIKSLEEHQTVQTEILEAVFSNLKVLQVKQLKTQRAVGAYRQIKK